MSYTFLSGSSISQDFATAILSSGECFLGFARSAPVWGQVALFGIEHRPSLSYPLDVIGTGTAVEPKFYDRHSDPGISVDKTRAFVLEVDEGVADYDFSDPNKHRFLTGATTGTLYIDYVDRYWAQIQGVEPNLLASMDVAKSYYLVCYDMVNGLQTAAKIRRRFTTDFSSYSTDVTVGYVEAGIVHELDLGRLSYTRNALGEHIVTGLDSVTKFISPADYGRDFVLMDAVTRHVLISGMQLEPASPDPAIKFFENGIESYLLFRYVTTYVDKTGASQSLEVLLKVSDTTNDSKQFSVYHESHSLETSVPIADNNPPALHVTYLRDGSISRSVFDVVGMERILPEDVKFIRELRSPEEKLRFASLSIATDRVEYGPSRHVAVLRSATIPSSSTISVQDGFSLVVGDVAYVNGLMLTVTSIVDLPGIGTVTFDSPIGAMLPNGSTVEAYYVPSADVFEFAWTQDLDVAAAYDMRSCLVDKWVPKDAPHFQGIYRQLLVSWRPKGYSLPSDVISDVWDQDKYAYEVGTLLYLAQKQPTYRKYVVDASGEHFKIVI